MSLFMGQELAMAATWPKKMGRDETKKRTLQTCAEFIENKKGIK